MAFSALAKPLVIDAGFQDFETPVVIVVTVIFSALLFTGKIGRSAGIAMLIGYVAFIGSQYLT